VIAEGDEQVDLCIKEEGSDKDVDMLLPPQIQTKACQLIITCLKAEALPKLDVGEDTCDAYIEASFAGTKVKTTHIEAGKGTLHVYWYERIYMPVIIPCVTGKLLLSVADWDALSSDDLVGSIVFDWTKVERGDYKEYFWANIYGPPLDVSGKNTDHMFAQPLSASYWRGRILIGIEVDKKEDKPKTKCIKMKEEELEETSSLVKSVYEYDNSM
jgi:hypothetical protein